MDADRPSRPQRSRPVRVLARILRRPLRLLLRGDLDLLDDLRRERARLDRVERDVARLEQVDRTVVQRMACVEGELRATQQAQGRRMASLETELAALREGVSSAPETVAPTRESV